MTLVIMAPELEPVTKTWLASPEYLSRAYATIFAIELESPPPLWVKAASLATSQQVPL